MVSSSPPHSWASSRLRAGFRQCGCNISHLVNPRRSTCCVFPSKHSAGCCVNARGINSEAYRPSNLFRSSTRIAQVIACQRQTPLLPMSPSRSGAPALSSRPLPGPDAPFAVQTQWLRVREPASSVCLLGSPACGLPTVKAGPTTPSFCSWVLQTLRVLHRVSNARLPFP